MNNSNGLQQSSVCWGPFLMRLKLSDDIIDSLKIRSSKVRGVKTLNVEDKLAAYFHDEWSFTNNDAAWFENSIIPYVKAYQDGLSKHIEGECNYPWKLSGLWVNYQKENDFNPIHHHNGDLSFVTYLDVPEELKTERERMKYKGTGALPGSIMFMYGESKPPLYDSRKFYMPENGDMFIFPSYLNHMVIPFRTPNIQRVSVAGNIIFNYDV